MEDFGGDALWETFEEVQDLPGMWVDVVDDLHCFGG